MTRIIAMQQDVHRPTDIEGERISDMLKWNKSLNVRPDQHSALSFITDHQPAPGWYFCHIIHNTAGTEIVGPIFRSNFTQTLGE